MHEMTGCEPTVSKTVHSVVRTSMSSALPLEVRACARAIARTHGIDRQGLWIVEQALVMVGARAGLSLKIGGTDDDSFFPAPITVRPLTPERAASSE